LSLRSRSRTSRFVPRHRLEVGGLSSALIVSLDRLLAPGRRLIDPGNARRLIRDLLRAASETTVSASPRLPADDLARSSGASKRGQRCPDSVRQLFTPFLLGSWPWCPGLIHRIPLAALSAMLVYYRFRSPSPQSSSLDSDRQGGHLNHLPGTIVGVLATALLVGRARKSR